MSELAGPEPKAHHISGQPNRCEVCFVLCFFVSNFAQLRRTVFEVFFTYNQDQRLRLSPQIAPAAKGK